MFSMPSNNTATHVPGQGVGPEVVTVPTSQPDSPPVAKKSKLGSLKKLLKSPAVGVFEKNVSKDKQDWGTGNKFGDGPYRLLAMTPGAADYYIAKGATGERPS
ncbi:hypothetical protein TruAng_009001 [Truncatella angustata]|nr:hypothetical protein TruAng_009001 [Truncatella angustata]